MTFIRFAYYSIAPYNLNALHRSRLVTARRVSKLNNDCTTTDSDAEDLHFHGRPHWRDLSPLASTVPSSSPLADATGLHSLASPLLWIESLARPDILTNATALVSCPSLPSTDTRRDKDTIAIVTSRLVKLHFPRLDPVHPAPLCPR